MPSEVVPASSITKLNFCCNHPEEIEMLCLIYNYIINNYTNLTEVDFDKVGLNDYEPSARRYFYLNGYVDLLKLIGPTQHERTLEYVPDSVDDFEVLDVVGSRIRHFNLYGCESE
jgi:hypothetical protein